MSEEYEYLLTAEAGEPGPVLARARLARRQAELLGALVAGGPVPAGFHAEQVRVQARGLAAKRRDTVAKVAPELLAILSDRFGPAFLGYAAETPMSGSYRADALSFAAWALQYDSTLTDHQLISLARWHTDRTKAAAPTSVGARLRAPLRSIARRSGRAGGGH